MKKIIAFVFVCLLGVSSLARASTALPLEGAININTATPQELLLLPGVGEVKAKQIIEARAQQKFAKKEDVLSIKGIGEKTLEKWSPYLIFDGVTTLKQGKGAAASVTATSAPAKP